ncbi:hypothetical protein ASZ90_005401 [hydrocarbon metagenome]|uniref:Uncharacterized protein n=1 Tax=hydrocarbon metagenome TaxID=938273 RepID=A0A0W8FWZ6_9ZZZZ
MKRKIVSLIAGALILFVWNALSWMVLPFHSNTLNSIPDNAINTELLKEHLTKDGVYHYPGFPKDDTPQALKEIENRIETGPRITLMVFKSGKTELFSAVSFLGSIAINFVTVFLLYSLIHLSRVQTTKTILLMTLFVALIIGFASDLAQMNWYLFPLSYTILNMVDHLIPFLLVGILFGKYSFKVKTV